MRFWTIPVTTTRSHHPLPIFWYKSSRLTAHPSVLCKWPRRFWGTDRDYCALTKVGNKPGEPAGYSCHNLNSYFLWSESVLITPEASGSAWNSSPTQCLFPEGLGLWTGECASGHLGLYLSTLQSSLEASAVFVLSVFPILNYASEALPVSSKGKRKNGFLKTLLWVSSPLPAYF